MKSVFMTLLILLLTAFLLSWIYLRHFERSKLFAPSPDISTTPAQFQLRFQEVHFVASDGTSLFGWWIPANRPRGTVVYCRGNAGNIGSSAHLAPEFTQRGFNLFLWDYRGYGRSGGRPSERGLYDDARSAYDAAFTMDESLPMILYGISLGGAVAIQLAADRPANGLIVEASFSSAADMAQRWYPRIPLHHVLSVSFDSAETAATLEGLPKLFGHSIQDDVIPFQSGRILHAAAASPKVFTLLEGGHNDSSWFTPGAPGNAELEAFFSQFKP